MELLVKRFNDTGDATNGLLFVDGDFQCFTLEDEYREVKVQGETRIPAGTYEVKFREVLSPMTKRYQDKFDWFKWHLQIMDVPGFTNIYIHIGNTDEHTEGCLLVGRTASVDGTVGNSTTAFSDLYAIVSDALNNGETVTITLDD